jgi:hypothetical protein
MFPGMIQMVICIVATSIMAHPLTIGVDMGRFGMSLFVVEFTVRLRCLPLFGRCLPLLLVRRSLNGSRAPFGNVASADIRFATMLLASASTLLRDSRQADHQKHRPKSNEFFHSHLRGYPIRDA